MKFVATQAKKYLDLTLAAADGAGTAVNGVCQFSQVDNYAPVTLGQLKFAFERGNQFLSNDDDKSQPDNKCSSGTGHPKPWLRMKAQIRHSVLFWIAVTGGLFSQPLPTPEEFGRLSADQVTTVFEAATASERQSYAKAAIASKRADIIEALLNDREGNSSIYEEIKELPASEWKDSLLLMTLEMVHGSDQTEGSFPPLGVPLQEPLLGLVRQYLPNSPPLQAHDIFYRLSREKLARELRQAMGLAPNSRQRLTAQQLEAAKMNTYELALEYEADVAAKKAKRINPPPSLATPVDHLSGASTPASATASVRVRSIPWLAVAGISSFAIALIWLLAKDRK